MSSDSEEGEDAIGDIESCKHEAPANTDPDKLIYTLRELKRNKHLFFVKRDFIRYGYRAHEDMNFKRCTSTMCMVHNETMNVYSHLIPGLYFLYHLVLILTHSGPYSVFTTQSSIYNMAFGTIAIIVCMVASSIYH